MSQRNIERFKSAVLEAEKSRDAGPLVALFAGSAALDSPAHETPLRGTAGATQFWSDYLDAFTTVKSVFTSAHAMGDTVALEWKSHGVLPTGRAMEYRGVSIMKFQGDLVQTFVTYYDSSHFVADMGGTGPVVVTASINNEGGD